MNVVPVPTRSVTCAFTLICAPVGVFTHTYSPSRTPRSLASFGLISTKHLLLQLGEPAVAARLLAAAFVLDEAAARQDQRELLGDLSLTFASCTDL